MRSNRTQDLIDQMKHIILGTQFTLFLISITRAYYDDLVTGWILGATIIFLQVLNVILKQGEIKLASNLFCIITFSVACGYMWAYEGVRDEVVFVLPSIIAFSLITGSRKTTLLLIASLIVGILSIGYLTDMGYRTQSYSTNSLRSSILILILMCFGIFIYWTLFNYLVRALRKIKNSLNTQSAILNNLGDSLLITDAGGIILQMSQNSHVLFGIESGSLVGKNISTVIPAINSAYQSIANNNQLESEHQYFKANKENGNQIDIKLVLTKTQIDSDATFIALVSDISESLHVQNELKLAKEAADKANQTKSDFLANMSHEIRTPMNGVMGALQILAREDLSENAKELLNTATISSSSLITIINDILDFSKIEAEKLTLEIVAFNLSKIIELLLNETNELAKSRNNSILVTKNDNYTEGWEGDPVRVKQIILNLLSNSLKFTENGEIMINLSIVNNGDLKVVVKDTGIGMSPETIENIFTRFQQADNSTTRKFGGTGLGISITRSLVNLMNGKIEVVSEIGKGTSFIVTLPLTPNQSNTDIINDIEEVSIPNLTGCTVLLAEDNRINQKIFEKMMLGTNVKIHIAENGLEAVKKASELKVDIIFMDIQMPEMDGREACKIIKEKHPLLPIIALTANVMVDDVKQYAMDGFEGHIGKPINLNELYRAINWYVL
jgi:PAS domain S-box-containing protein